MVKNFFSKSKLFLVALLIFTATTGQSCLKGGSIVAQQAYKPIELTYWRVFDGQDTLQPLFDSYNKLHPNVTIKYRQLRFEEYEKELINALAEDRGPDIFSIHNSWIRQYQSKLLPLPAKTILATPVTTGTIKKETVIELRAEPSLTLRQLKNNFIDQVAKDVVIKDITASDPALQDKIYGLPLGVDTLAMFYNRDLFNNAGLATPPANWAQFQDGIRKLTKLDRQSKILLSGAAMGTSTNVARSNDLLSVLMMQNGAVMASDDGRAQFQETPSTIQRDTPPGLEALRFYTDFANPTKDVYTWNSQLPNSLDAFVTGQTAIFFGYAFNVPVIKARAPKLNWALAKLPQIEGNPEVNFANYWVEVVSKKSKNSDFAWSFLQYITSADNVKKHLDLAKKPTALRVLINNQREDIDLSVFASQLLTSKSWYQGKNPNAAENIFSQMIDQAVAGTGDLSDILNLAAGRVNQTMR